MNNAGKKSDPTILKTLSSIQFGIVVLVVIALVATIGTIIPQGRPVSFYYEHFGSFFGFLISMFRFDITYRSPLFIGLMVLFGINLTLCSLIRFPSILRNTFKPDTAPAEHIVSHMPVHISVKNSSPETAIQAFEKSGLKLHSVGTGRYYGEKGRFGYLGSTIVHISLLVFLIGGVTTLLTGQRAYIVLEKGDTASTAMLADDEEMPLGFEITLRDFTVEFYEDFPGRPKSYQSSVAVEQPGEEPFIADIRVNHPLMLNGLTVFQSSYGPSESGSNITADHDTASVSLQLKGVPEDMPPIVTLDMIPGEMYPVPGFGDSMEVFLSELHRDFRRIASPSGGGNPAVRIDVQVAGENKWSVYAFQNFPGMNMPMTEELPVLFTLNDIKYGPTEGGEPGYYTVLGVSKDHGIPLVWTGAILMMIGLMFSFYIRPKRVWMIVKEDSGLLIGARTKGDSQTLRDWVQSVVTLMKDKK